MIWLLYINLLFADAVDHIQNGKYTENTACSICGGRILCGALKESIKLDGIVDSQTEPLLNFCFQKTSELQEQSKTHKPWVSSELSRYLKISNLVTKIAERQSRGKYSDKLL